MISFFADVFGYVLNALYQLVNNYGFAIILFSILLKLVMLPISIKQQKTMKKSAKIQEKLKVIQDKNNPEKLNQETLDLYKNEKMSPFSGCLSSIAQIVILFAVFYLVRSPLTYMKKVEPDLINQYTTEIQQEDNKNTAYPEIAIIKEKGSADERVHINMDFLGLDLSSVPSQDLSDWRVYVIPGLYVLTSFISMRMTTSMQQTKKKEEENGEPNEMDAVAQANKSMSLLMPIMSVSIAIIAPLGLALYWLVNNILMIVERFVLNKFLKEEEEA